MEISREDFERAIKLSYQRGRITPVRYIAYKDIDDCISDVYELLDIQPPDTDTVIEDMDTVIEDMDTVIEDEYKDKYHIFK